MKKNPRLKELLELLEGAQGRGAEFRYSNLRPEERQQLRTIVRKLAKEI